MLISTGHMVAVMFDYVHNTVPSMSYGASPEGVSKQLSPTNVPRSLYNIMAVALGQTMIVNRINPPLTWRIIAQGTIPLHMEYVS